MHSDHLHPWTHHHVFEQGRRREVSRLPEALGVIHATVETHRCPDED